MRLTVIGNNGPYPGVGNACSGYLIQNKNTNILLDCGNGVLSRLQNYISIEEIDAIILTHLHSDHISDVLILKYALGIRRMRGSYDKSISLYTTTEDMTQVNKLNYNEAFEIFPIEENKLISLGGLEITFKEMTHPVRSFALKMENKDKNKTLVYSGDTSYNEGLIEFAQGADVFLCESGLLEKDRDDNSPHLSAKQVGEIASRSKVNKLLLTHFWPEYNPQEILSEAREQFSENIELSKEMETYYI